MPIIEGTTADPLLYAGTPSNGTDEVQTITYGSASASGAFVIAFEGYRTTSLPWNESAANVQTALRALPSIGALGCSVTLAGAPTNVYQITFDGGNMLKRNQPLVSVYSSTVAEAGLALVTLTVATLTPGVNATGLGSPVGKMLIDTSTGAMYVNSGTALAPVWTAYTTTSAGTAEINLIDGSVAGTSVASKALVLGASKNTDILGLPVGGLKIGAAGAEVVVTPTAAELNVLASVTPGTAAASSALVTNATIDIATLRNVTATGTIQGANVTGVTLVSGAAVTATNALTGATVVAKHPVIAVAASGAIAVPTGNTTYFITKAGVAAMTLVDPTATTHDGLRLTFISATAESHTLSNAAGSGFNGVGAGADIGTFGGAIGDHLIIEAYQGKWYVIDNVGVVLA
jgi:hypothetical protein